MSTISPASPHGIAHPHEPTSNPPPTDQKGYVGKVQQCVIQLLKRSESTGKTPPASPMKRRMTLPPKFVHSKTSSFRRVSDSIQNHSFKRNGVSVTFSSFSEKGSYVRVLSPYADDSLVPGVSNDQLLIKIYNEKLLTKTEACLKNYMSSSLKNYEAAKHLGLPVSTIFNAATALEDTYFIVEKVPYPIDVNSPDHVKQVHRFFQAAFDQKSIFDLLPDNFCVKEDGTVVLVDFVEDTEDGFDIFLKHALKTWAKRFAESAHYDREATRTSLKQLTEGLNQFDPQWIDEILECIFY